MTDITKCFIVATVLTVYGIETVLKVNVAILVQVATVLTVYGIETLELAVSGEHANLNELQQCLPFTVCAEGCETAEEQSDDEVRTSQVPERSEGKTKVIK